MTPSQSSAYSRKPAPQNREELLDGLYTVKSYLINGKKKFREYCALENKMRSKKSGLQRLLTNSAPQQAQAGLERSERIRLTVVMYVALASVLLFAIRFLDFSNMMSSANPADMSENFDFVGVSVSAWGLIISLIIWNSLRLKKKKNTFSSSSFIRSSVIVALFAVANVATAGNTSITPQVIVVVYALTVGIGYFAADRLYKKELSQAQAEANEVYQRNENEIARANVQISARNAKIEQEIQALREQQEKIVYEMKDLEWEMLEESESWYPRDYYSLEAVTHFISILQNHKADTVKEMVNVYDEEGFRAAALLNQQEVNAAFEQALDNQEKLVELQEHANFLQTVQTVSTLVTEMHVNDIAHGRRPAF